MYVHVLLCICYSSPTDSRKFLIDVFECDKLQLHEHTCTWQPKCSSKQLHTYIYMCTQLTSYIVYSIMYMNVLCTCTIYMCTQLYSIQYTYVYEYTLYMYMYRVHWELKLGKKLPWISWRLIIDTYMYVHATCTCIYMYNLMFATTFFLLQFLRLEEKNAKLSTRNYVCVMKYDNVYIFKSQKMQNLICRKIYSNKKPQIFVREKFGYNEN